MKDKTYCSLQTNAGPYFTDSTSVRGQELILEEECHGPGSSLSKRPNRLFQLILLMAMNGFLAPDIFNLYSEHINGEQYCEINILS